MAAINSVISQAIGSALGIQSFSWRGVAAAAVTAGVVEAGGQLISAISGGNVDLSKQDTGSSQESNNGVGGIILGLPSTQVAMSTVARNVIGLIGAVAGSAVQNRGKIEWRSIAINAVGNSIGAKLVEIYRENNGQQNDQQKRNYLFGGDTESKARVTFEGMKPNYALPVAGFRLPSVSTPGDWVPEPVAGSAESQSAVVEDPRALYGADGTGEIFDNETGGRRRTFGQSVFSRAYKPAQGGMLDLLATLNKQLPVTNQQRESFHSLVMSELNATQELDASQSSGFQLVSKRNTGKSGQINDSWLVRRQGLDASLNLATDVPGLLSSVDQMRRELGPLSYDVQKAKVESIRADLIKAGVPNIERLIATSLSSNERGGGVIWYDPPETLNQLRGAYENHLRDRRLTEVWGTNYETLRIGKSAFTVTQFEQKVFDIQSQAANMAYEDALRDHANKRTNWSKDKYATELGLYIDRQVRRDLRDFALSEGIVENRFNPQFAVNRMIFDPTIGKAFPDTRLGNNLFYDTTISPKSFIGPSAEQLLRWNDMRGGYFLMIRPDAFGGSYVLPRSTLPAVRPNIGKGKT